jgi:NADH dehydrogenase
MSTERLIVAGGGYAGLAAIRALVAGGHPTVDLIDPSPVHQLVTELPDAFRPGGSVDAHVIPFDALLQGTRVTRHQDTVVHVDVRRRQLFMGSGDMLTFKSLVGSIGSTTQYVPVPGLRRHAIPFRTAADARGLQERLTRRTGQRVVVMGGGLTGVELAGALAGDHHVMLVERAARILPGFGPGLAQYAGRILRSLGVVVWVSHAVVAVNAADVVLEGGAVIAYDTLVWAGGIAPSSELSWDGVEVDGDGYPVADGWGQVAPGVFIAGDLWRVAEGGRVFPQTAIMAIEAGRFVGQAMLHWSHGHALGPPFRPHVRGMLVSLDAERGVGWVVNRGLSIRGCTVPLLKNLVFARYRRRLAAAFPEYRRM